MYLCEYIKVGLRLFEGNYILRHIDVCIYCFQGPFNFSKKQPPAS